MIAADVYSVPPHRGRGGWTWYTGSAAWMYRSGLEAILGITRRADNIVVAPRIPQAWNQCEVVIHLDGSVYEIRIEQATEDAERATLDGIDLAPVDGEFLIPIHAAGKHRFLLRHRYRAAS